MAVSFQEAPGSPPRGLHPCMSPHCYSRFNRQTLCKWIWQKGDLLHIFSRGAGVSSAVGWSGSASQGFGAHTATSVSQQSTSQVIPQVTPFHPSPSYFIGSLPLTHVQFSRVTERFTCALCGPPTRSPLTHSQQPPAPPQGITKEDL